MAGNPHPEGPKSDKIWRGAIMRAVRRAESGEPTSGAQRLEKLADALVEKGLAGDVPAMKEIGDRLDGRPHQTTDVALNRPRDMREWTTEELTAFLNETGGPPSPGQPSPTDEELAVVVTGSAGSDEQH